MSSSDLPCSASSAAAGEPLAGTAVESTWLWVGIEHRGAWPPGGADEVAWPEPIAAWLEDVTRTAGARVHLVRRPGREGPLAVWLADTRPTTPRLWRADLEALETLDVEALLADRETLARRVSDPVVWVCTHGTRDRCCGLLGGQTFKALQRVLGERVWQTSHLGGHRFAPTLLWLPEGLCFGRVPPEDAHAHAHAMLEGRVHDVSRIRGRTAWSRPAQAAEVALRRALPWHPAAAPALLGAEVVGDVARVTFEADGVSRRVTLRRQAHAGPVSLSCGKPPEPGSGWIPQ